MAQGGDQTAGCLLRRHPAPEQYGARHGHGERSRGRRQVVNDGKATNEPDSGRKFQKRGL